MVDKSKLSIWQIVLVGFAGYFGSKALSYLPKSNYIPSTEKVQEGYAIPNKLEIKLEDLDGNGKEETIMRYNGKSYLLKIDDAGNPTVQTYEIRSVEVVPKDK